MWPDQVRALRHRWRGFTDTLGERIVVETTSGLRWQGLFVARSLVTRPSDIDVLCHEVLQFTRISHPNLIPPRDVERPVLDSDVPVVLSDYAPGTRLSAWLDARRGEPVPTGTILHVVQKVSDALQAISAQSAGRFHGAVGLERIVVGPEGRVRLVEPGLGALLAGQPTRTPSEWWRHYRLAVPFTADVPRFGPATDACQLGLVALQLLLGRPLAEAEYPDNLAVLVGTAEETDLVGTRSPLGLPLFEWLAGALGLESTSEPSLDGLARKLEALLGEDTGYVAVPVGLDVPAPPLEPMPTTPVIEFVPTDHSLSWTQDVPRPTVPDSPRTREEQAHAEATQWPAASFAAAAPALPSTLLDPVQAAVTAPRRSTIPLAHAAPDAVPRESFPAPWQRPAETDRAAGAKAPSNPHSIDLNLVGYGSIEIDGLDAGQADARPRPRPATTSADHEHRLEVRRRPRQDVIEDETPRWRATLRLGIGAVLLTVLVAGALAGWLAWRERHLPRTTVTLEVDTDPTGATVLIDGVERGTAPVSLAVMPGKHELLAKSAAGLGRVTVDVSHSGPDKVIVPLEFGTDPGVLEVSSDPAGALVQLDGEPKGRSPVLLDDVVPGEHTLGMTVGRVEFTRRFTLGPAERLTMFVPLAGGVSVKSAVPLRVIDKGRDYGVTDEGRILVPSGRRRLRFVNRELGIDQGQDVLIVPGKTATLSVPLPSGLLSVTSDPPADLWIDREFRGKTPTGNLSVAVGEHEVLVSHPRWGEQRLTVVVGLGAPTRLSVKLTAVESKRSHRGSPNRSGISAAR